MGPRFFFTPVQNVTGKERALSPQTQVALFEAHLCQYPVPHATRTVGHRAVGLAHVKAAGRVQVYDLP